MVPISSNYVNTAPDHKPCFQNAIRMWLKPIARNVFGLDFSAFYYENNRMFVISSNGFSVNVTMSQVFNSSSCLELENIVDSKIGELVEMVKSNAT